MTSMDYKIGYHYHIEHKIGHGDLGDVYIGTDEKRRISYISFIYL